MCLLHLRRLKLKYALLKNLFLILIGLSSAASAQNSDETVTWLSNYNVAKAYARDNGLPLLVSFRCVP